MLTELPAVAIEGAKGVGKTATASRRARTVLTLSDPRARSSVAANYDLITQVPAPVLIDEWQLEPSVWERVRAAVDQDPLAGARFLLAGSAGVSSDVRLHSGAGRIVRLLLRPMALSERGLDTGSGEDPHVYVLKVEDHKKIENGDLILYHGLHFEGKMIDILEKKGQAVSRNFPKDKIGKMEEDGKEVIDPHFWFDISLYKNAVEAAAEELVKLVPEEKAFFEKNLKEYLQKLDDLDKYNKEQISKIPKGSRYLITPHDAFNYFAKSYNIEVKAPQGVSSATRLPKMPKTKKIAVTCTMAM